VIVVAPDGEQNAASHAITLHKPLRVTRLARRRLQHERHADRLHQPGVITIAKERPR
jgi:broad specificity polyphosphatase/5'/3'-nucleotidase SurE